MKLLPLRARRYLVLALALLAGAGVVAGWSLSGRPVALPDGPERLDCASYAPPRFDATDRPATPAEIEADLRIVARRFQCIRTYSTEGIDNVPAAARAAGLTVLLGAWIGSDPRSNRREVERVIDLANRNRGVIDAVVVGNEVFLRRELSVEKLRALLVEVKARTGLPVTTADIWAFWPQDPEFLDAVSFMMVHILPYWDDEPVSIDAVLPHVQQVYADMTRKFPGKVIMIGETGWPSAGRPRGALEAGRVNAARYVREFTAWAAASGIRYNLIEAFDQPWKRPNEGTVGGFWGLYDQAGLEKFPLQGPVMENPRWRTSLGFSLAAGVLLPLAVAVMRRRALSVAAGLFLGLAGLSAMGAILWQSAYLQAGNRDWLDWCVTLTWAAAGWSVAGFVVAAVTRWLDAPETGGGPVRLPRERLLGSRLFRAARFTVLLGAAYVALGLVLAGRHRDFPLALLAVPAVALLALEAAGGLQRRSVSDPEQFLLGMWLAVAAPLVVWIEGTGNSSALAVSGLFLILAWPVLRLPPEAGQHQGARHHANGGKLEAVENGASDARAQGQVSQRR